MVKYKNVISLGFFCSTSLELEKIGLRETSSPFDWLISDLKGVIDCIDNGFEGILKYENLSQYKEIPDYYVDTKYKLHFYHDFSRYETLDSQLPNVRDKYNRRIRRFYENIKEPTLFLRYIVDGEELAYLESNYNEIISVLKKHNENNNLILISNDDIRSNSLQVYTVEKDKKDTVARKFLSKNKELRDFLRSDIYDKDKRLSNLQTFKKGNRKKKVLKIPTTVLSRIKRKVVSPYIHNTTW